MKNTGKESFQQTSMKKYPYNKYFQYREEDASFKKNLTYGQPSLSNRCIPMYDDEDDKQNCQLQSNHILKPVQNKQHNDTFIEFGDYCAKKTKSQKFKKASSSCNQSVCHNLTSTRQRKSLNRTKMSTSKMEDSKKKRSKPKKKDASLNSNNENQQLKYYQKLCLEMRKKNCHLNNELKECKQKNKQSLHKLQKKVDKISQGYQHQKKYETDSHKMQKIFESLRSINGKLNKKTVIQNQETNKYKKFYDFFIESLGVLEPNGKITQKTNSVELQLIWKQILQFLIMHDFKLEDAYKGQYSKNK